MNTVANKILLNCGMLLSAMFPAGLFLLAVGCHTLPQPEDPVEAAKRRGLNWLRAVQNPDGSWPENPVAMTALALSTFLAAGETPGNSPEFDDAIMNGIDYLLFVQSDNGRFSIHDDYDFTHPIATWALWNLCAVTNSPAVHDAAEKALNPILASQRTRGGWGKRMTWYGSEDMAYTDWCLRALRAARMAKFIYDPNPLDAEVRRSNEKLDQSIFRASAALRRLDKLDIDAQPQWNGPTPSTIGRFCDFFTSPSQFYPIMASRAEQYRQFRVEQMLWDCYRRHGDVRHAEWSRKAAKLYVNAQFIMPPGSTSCPCLAVNTNGPCLWIARAADKQGNPCALGHWINGDFFGDRPVMDTCLVLLQLCKPNVFLPLPPEKAPPPPFDPAIFVDIPVDTDL